MARKPTKRTAKGKAVKRIKDNLRRGVRHALVRTDDKPIKYVGCTPTQLRAHLQEQFEEGMTWDNYGQYWHIDHIIPLSYFNLRTIVGRTVAMSYTNLQPLHKDVNLRKGTSLQTHALATLAILFVAYNLCHPATLAS